MINILARGGIEFLAVLLGISLSLWVEDWRQNNEIASRLNLDYLNIKQEINEDIDNINNIISKVENQILALNNLVDYYEGKTIFDKDDLSNNLGTITAPTFYGTKTLTFAPAERYHVFQISGGYSFGFTRGDFIHVQADVIFDQSLPFLSEYDYEFKSIDNVILGIFSTYEKKFGQIGTFIGLGLYAHSPYKSYTGNWDFANKGGYLYNRIGIKYYITKNICAQVSARTHLGSADNTEFGIVYNFK